MRLSKKLIDTVFKGNRNQETKYLTIELDGQDLQDKLAEHYGLSVQELDTLKLIKSKLSGNYYNYYICHVYNKHIDVGYYDNLLIRLSIKLTGSRENIVVLNNSFPTEVLKRHYSDKIVVETNKQRDWNTILTAFATVEEAIEVYPELRSKFEGFFGKKF